MMEITLTSLCITMLTWIYCCGVNAELYMPLPLDLCPYVNQNSAKYRYDLTHISTSIYYYKGACSDGSSGSVFVQISQVLGSMFVIVIIVVVHIPYSKLFKYMECAGLPIGLFNAMTMCSAAYVVCSMQWQWRLFKMVFISAISIFICYVYRLNVCAAFQA